MWFLVPTILSGGAAILAGGWALGKAENTIKWGTVAAAVVGGGYLFYVLKKKR